MTSKRKHVTLSIKDKVQLIKDLEAGASLNELAKKYKVGKSTISDINKKKDMILSYAKTSSNLLCKRKTLKAGGYPEVDEALYNWYLQERSGGVTSISGEVLREKAQFFYSQTYNDDNFKASSGWLDRFKKRYGFQQTSREQAETCESTSNGDIFQLLGIETKSKDEVFSEEMLPERVKHKDAVRSFETCLKWAQENAESETNLLVLSGMKKRAEEACKQRKITDFYAVI